jgi:predicted lipid-binding transport protein (Tim44 family)
MGLAIAIGALVAILTLLGVLAVTISKERRRQVDAYTPEQRRRQAVRGSWVRLGESISELDDAAHEHDHNPEVSGGWETAKRHHEAARKLIDAGDPDAAEREIGQGRAAIDGARATLYADAGRTPPRAP